MIRYLLMASHVPGSGAGGGVVRYTVGLAEALARRDDVELHVLTAGDGAEFFGRFLPASHIHRLPGLPTPVLSLLERGGLLPGGRFDVVHGTKHIVPWRAAGARRVLTVHDMLLFDRGRDYPLLKRLLLRGPYRGSIRQADALLAVSRATAARLVDHMPTAATRITIAPLAPSPALTEATPTPVPALVGTRFALVVGDASARKNLALAVGTWAQVREHVPDAVLAVVGPTPWGAEDRGGAAWDALRAEGAAVGLRGISDGELRWCYENAQVVLCPSLLEGFGLPTVEAAAFGTPVITSEDPALCEAAAGWGVATPTWSPAEWTASVAKAMTHPTRPTPPPRRTWDDVAADTISRDPAPLTAPRIGVSPFDAPLHVRHVVTANARDTADRLAAAHRARGWTVDVDVDEPTGPADVIVLHGPAAGRARRKIRGTIPTVLLATPGPQSWPREAALARWTNVLVLPPGASRGWTRINAPVTRLPTSPLDTDEAAAIFTRALAWGPT